MLQVLDFLILGKLGFDSRRLNLIFYNTLLMFGSLIWQQGWVNFNFWRSSIFSHELVILILIRSCFNLDVFYFIDWFLWWTQYLRLFSELYLFLLSLRGWYWIFTFLSLLCVRNFIRKLTWCFIFWWQLE